MNLAFRKWRSALFGGVAISAVSCTDGRQESPAPSPRPVTVIELRETEPDRPLALTGSVEAWTQQDVALEVSGRVTGIVEAGTYLEGRVQEDGKTTIPGDVLARLDPATYEAALEAAKAEVENARVQLEKVLPARLDKAEANRLFQETEYERVRALPETARVDIELTRAKASLDIAAAEVRQTMADTKAAEAKLKKARADLDQAELDLKHTELDAPFSGEVSAVHVEAGGYVQAGQTVAHLVMMDPMKVNVAVSQVKARKLKVRDTVRVEVEGVDEPVYGFIHEKATVADPQTRTFRISIIVRNQRMFKPPPGSLDRDYPVITDFYYLNRFRVGEEGSPFGVEGNRALRREGDAYYVWAAPDHKLGDRMESETPVLTLRKFTVVPGERRMNLQGRYLFQSLEDIGKLEPGMLIACNVPEGLPDGGQVVVTRQEWALYPGQLVQVFLDVGGPARGFYVPMDAIRPIDDANGEVFVARDGRAARVRVRLMGHVGEGIRIEAAEPGDGGMLLEGARLITDYIHFLQDDEPVQVVKTRELRL